jgi:hypothetical protein
MNLLIPKAKAALTRYGHHLVIDWSDSMAAEFNSLQQKNTGLLVPPPDDDKIIGGM